MRPAARCERIYVRLSAEAEADVDIGTIERAIFALALLEAVIDDVEISFPALPHPRFGWSNRGLANY